MSSVPIGELSEGHHARVAGTVRSVGSTIDAPFSGRACVAFYVRVKGQIGPRGTAMKVDLVEQGGIPFAIEDGSGRAIVDPQHAKLELVLDQDAIVGETSARANAFCERHGIAISHGLLHYYEGVIEVGDQVTVLGAGVQVPDPEAPPYRGDPAMVLRLACDPETPIEVTGDHHKRR